MNRANGNKLDTSKLTSYVTGSPVLSNLLDFDSLLLKVDLVNSKRIKNIIFTRKKEKIKQNEWYNE